MPARGSVLEYYQLLRSIWRAKPKSPACLKRCRQCRIFFLTHRRNAGRSNLRCPFGCREAHRKRESTRRSVAFYREHKEKKQRQNGKRAAQRSGADPDGDGAKRDPSPAKETIECAGCPAEPERRRVPPQLVEHVRVVVSLIEGRRVGQEEIVLMLAKVLRQHSIGRRRKIDHAVAWLNENPP